MPEAALLLVLTPWSARGGRAPTCFDVVLEVNAERQHEERRGEEDREPGVRTRSRVRASERERESERIPRRERRRRRRERKRIEEKKRERETERERETRVRVSNVWRPERHWSRKRHAVSPLERLLSSLSYPAAMLRLALRRPNTSAFSRPHLPLHF